MRKTGSCGKRVGCSSLGREKHPDDDDDEHKKKSTEGVGVRVKILKDGEQLCKLRTKQKRTIPPPPQPTHPSTPPFSSSSPTYPPHPQHTPCPASHTHTGTYAHLHPNPRSSAIFLSKVYKYEKNLGVVYTACLPDLDYFNQCFLYHKAACKTPATTSR